jgi:hypothetical protein
MIIERDYGEEAQKSQVFESKLEKSNSWGIIKK